MAIRKMTSLLWTLCAFVALTSAVQADQAAQVKKAIQAAIDKANAAIVKKDIKGAMASMTPDYVSIDKKGKQSSLAEEKQTLSMVLATAKNLKVRSVIQKLTLKGKDAIAVVTDHAEMNLQSPRGSQTVHLVVDSTSEETWIKSARGWLRKRSKTLTEKATMDGQPVPENLGEMDKSL